MSGRTIRPAVHPRGGTAARSIADINAVIVLPGSHTIVLGRTLTILAQIEEGYDAGDGAWPADHNRGLFEDGSRNHCTG